MIINNIIVRFALPVFSDLPRDGSKIVLGRRRKPLRNQWLLTFADILRTENGSVQKVNQWVNRCAEAINEMGEVPPSVLR